MIEFPLPELPALPATLHGVCTTAQPLSDGADSRLPRQLLAGLKGEHPCHGGLRTRGQFKNTRADRPLISIVTIVFNGERYLEHTIRSVLALADEQVEYIIIDGGSTDGTLDIIRRYEHAIDYWRSQPDAGIADAFNQGLALTRGDWVGMINADDWYAPQALQRVRPLLDHADIISGDLCCHFPGFDLVLPARPQSWRCGMFMNHPACFVRASLYAQHGGYSSEWRLAMDYDWLVRAIAAGARCLRVHAVQAHMRMIGISMQQRVRGRREVWQIRRRHLGLRWQDTLRYFCIRLDNQRRRRLAQLRDWLSPAGGKGG